jgi:hypothetical protein
MTPAKLAEIEQLCANRPHWARQLAADELIAAVREKEAQVEKLRAGIEQVLSDFGDEYPARMEALQELLAATAPEGDRG